MRLYANSTTGALRTELARLRAKGDDVTTDELRTVLKLEQALTDRARKGTKPMTFELKFSMDNAAFADDPGYETARILAEVATRLRDHLISAPDQGTVCDANGNSVGKWRIKD